MRPRPIALLGRRGAIGSSAVAAVIVAPMPARLVTAMLMTRFAMTMTVRTARLFGLGLLGVGQFRQVVRHSIDLVADQPFDVAQIASLRPIAERDRDPRPA